MHLSRPQRNILLLNGWMVPDPLGQGFSPYVGMGNNPVSFFDPTGGYFGGGGGDDGDVTWGYSLCQVDVYAERCNPEIELLYWMIGRSVTYDFPGMYSWVTAHDRMGPPISGTGGYSLKGGPTGSGSGNGDDDNDGNNSTTPNTAGSYHGPSGDPGSLQKRNVIYNPLVIDGICIKHGSSNGDISTQSPEKLLPPIGKRGMQVLPPNDDFLDYASDFFMGDRTWIDEWGFEWNVGSDGKTTGMKPQIGFPPDVGRGGFGGREFIKGFGWVGRELFHRITKPGILKYIMNNIANYERIVGRNPDVIVKKGQIFLKAMDKSFKGAEWATGLQASDWLELLL
jgi:hypothetical protein